MEREKAMRELRLVHPSLFRKGDHPFTQNEGALIRECLDKKFRRMVFCSDCLTKMFRCVLLWVVGQSDRKSKNHVVLTATEVNDIKFGNDERFPSISSVGGKFPVVSITETDLNGNRMTEEILTSLAQVSVNRDTPVVFWFVGTRERFKERLPSLFMFLSGLGYRFCDLTKADAWAKSKRESSGK